MIKLLSQLNSLCFFRNALEDPILSEFYQLAKDLGQPEPKISSAQEHYFLLRSKLADYALKITHPSAQTAWQNYIIGILTAENETTLNLEKSRSFMFENTLKADLEVFSQVYRFNFGAIVDRLDPKSSNLFQKEIFETKTPLSVALENGDADGIYNALLDYISNNGLGTYARAKVFKVNEKFREDGTDVLIPVHIGKVKGMEDLVGYESQKSRLIKNTKSFVEGRGGLNTLLYGEMGTGKSTMIKALTKVFDNTPLRFIELKKSELKFIPDVYRTVAGTNYPFILFIDDLSFDDDDTSYRELKNALEGSFEQPPENIILYATSNKRTLVSQSKSEREDAVNAREVLEEKLSLVSRFGLTIPFMVPKQSDYLNIVETLAQASGLVYNEETKESAIQWELRHMNRSGRTAEQFIQYLLTDDDRGFEQIPPQD